MMISYFMAIYLVWYKPMESPLANVIEVMNEYTIIVLLYGLMCFTDFLPSPNSRSVIGLVYIGVFITNVFVHIIKLLLQTCYKMKLGCKKYHFRWKNIKKKKMKSGPLSNEECEKPYFYEVKD